MGTSSTVVALAVATGLLLSACAWGPGTPPTSSSPSPSASVSEDPTEAPIPPDPYAPSGQCADDVLRVTIEPNPEGNSTGHVVSNVVFTNTGTTSCELQGAPSVAVIDVNGAVIGSYAASLEGPVAQTITIEPGGRAVAGLSAADIGEDGGSLGELCPTVAGSGYLVHPPHSSTFVEVPADVRACEGDVPWMTITAVRGG